ncbi:MAG: thrombospondin type-1 domain-containing protein [Patescibacteria group bacterium]
MTFSKQLLQVFPLALIVIGLLSYNFMSAQWTSPTGAAPGNNTPAPINAGISSTTIQSAQGYLLFNRFAAVNAVWSPQYCNIDGTVCVSGDELASGGSGSGLGYDQEWQIINRTQGVWYRNTTSQPIMIFHKNINSGTSISVGAATTTAVEMNYQDYDSDLDNGSTIVIPQNHYYRMNTGTENSADGHRVYRELREPSNIVYTYAWSIGTWGSCGPTSLFNTCSSVGTQSRTVTCRRSDGITMSDSFCTGTKPTASQSCTRQPTGDC